VPHFWLVSDLHLARVKFSHRSPLPSSPSSQPPERQATYGVPAWGLGDRLLWGFGRPSKAKTYKTKRPTNEMRETERGSESTIEPPKIAAARPVVLCYFPRQPPTCHARLVVASFVRICPTLTQLPTSSSRHADMAPKRSYRALGFRGCVCCYVALRQLSFTSSRAQSLKVACLHE